MFTTGSWRTAEFRMSGVEFEFLSFGALALESRVGKKLDESTLLKLCEGGVNVSRSGLVGGIGGAVEDSSTSFRGIARAYG